MREAVITTVARTAVGRAKRGSLKDTQPVDFAAPVLNALIERTPGLEASDVEDVLFGCAMPEAEQGLNVARQIVLAAGFPIEIPGTTINRNCSSGSQTIAFAADSIRAGHADVIIAGGVESMSLIPMGGNKLITAPGLTASMIDAYDAMGTTAEILARQFGVSREDQDAFALRSHQRAIAAIQGGKFKDEIVPMKVRTMTNGKWKEYVFDTDEGPRPDTSLAALAKLRPAFDPRGSVTAGTSSQMNDGAAAVVLMTDEKAKSLGLEPLAYVRDWAVAGVPPEVMGLGPTKAIPKLLARAGLTLDDIDVIELNEAFAVQALCCIRELGLDMEKVNVNGGALATGHPLGATGAILTVKILGEMKRRNARRGMVTMCIGGGQGFAYLLERPQNSN